MGWDKHPIVWVYRGNLRNQELFLSQIQVPALKYRGEATLHCRPEVLEEPWCHLFLLIGHHCRGTLWALWCCSLILPYVGYNSSQNKVGGGFYSHWITQGAAGSVTLGRSDQDTWLWKNKNKFKKDKDKEKEKAPGWWDLELPDLTCDFQIKPLIF